MGSLSPKQADKHKYVEYLIKDKQTLHVFLTGEDYFFFPEQVEYCFKAMIILLQTLQHSPLRSYKAAVNRNVQLHQCELLNCICISEAACIDVLFAFQL